MPWLRVERASCTYGTRARSTGDIQRILIVLSSLPYFGALRQSRRRPSKPSVRQQRVAHLLEGVFLPNTSLRIAAMESTWSSDRRRPAWAVVDHRAADGNVFAFSMQPSTSSDISGFGATSRCTRWLMTVLIADRRTIWAICFSPPRRNPRRCAGRAGRRYPALIAVKQHHPAAV